MKFHLAWPCRQTTTLICFDFCWFPAASEAVGVHAWTCWYDMIYKSLDVALEEHMYNKVLVTINHSKCATAKCKATLFLSSPLLCHQYDWRQERQQQWQQRQQWTAWIATAAGTATPTAATTITTQIAQARPLMGRAPASRVTASRANPGLVDVVVDVVVFFCCGCYSCCCCNNDNNNNDNNNNNNDNKINNNTANWNTQPSKICKPCFFVFIRLHCKLKHSTQQDLLT